MTNYDKDEGMTPEEVLALPVAVRLMVAAKALDISKNKAYELAKAGQFPVPVLRIGNSYRVRRADLLDYLGIKEPK